MSCLLVAGVAVMLSGPEFVLRWTHSVERVDWVEHWQVGPDHLHLVEARVRGSGAGMEPGPDARRVGEWWVWSPDRRVEALNLAASGATGAGWRLCDGPLCREAGATPSAGVVIAPCPH